jgi:hypothetical protein
MTLEEKLVELDKVNAWLAKGKARADALREEIKQEALRLQLIENKEGAASVEFPVNGIAGKLTVTRKINRSLDQKLVPALKQYLPSDLFKEKTELVVAQYRKLSAEQLSILANGLKESEGLPVISWEPKKD